MEHFIKNIFLFGQSKIYQEIDYTTRVWDFREKKKKPAYGYLLKHTPCSPDVVTKVLRNMYKRRVFPIRKSSPSSHVTNKLRTKEKVTNLSFHTMQTRKYLQF